MEIKFETTNKTTYNGRGYRSLAKLLEYRKVIGSNRGARSPAMPDVVEEYNSVYSKYLNPLLDKIIAQSVGAIIITSSSGKGTVFDNLHVKNGTPTGTSETKSINVTTDDEGNVLSANPIHIATDAGINLSTISGLYTGINKDFKIPKGVTELRASSGILESTDINREEFNPFIAALVAAKGKQEELKALLSGSSAPATQLRNNFMMKSGDIKVPIVVAGKPMYKSIKFDWKAIVENPNAKIKITVTDKGVFFNIVLEQKLVTEALQKAKYENFSFTEKYATALNKSIAETLGHLTSEGVKFIKTQLPKKVRITKTVENEHGSVLVYRGAFTADKSKKTSTKPKNTPKPQKFISSAQWTYLVQKRLGDSMLSFGDPEPPDIKERSGRFRRSVDVTANYRTKVIQYTYNPLYRSLEHYGYHPELQVERSIRQVAQDLYAREFSIVRRGGLA